MVAVELVLLTVAEVDVKEMLLVFEVLAGKQRHSSNRWMVRRGRRVWTQQLTDHLSLT